MTKASTSCNEPAASVKDYTSNLFVSSAREGCTPVFDCTMLSSVAPRELSKEDRPQRMSYVSSRELWT